MPANKLTRKESAMTPMSKKEAEERLLAIEKEVATLRQIINTPEKAPSLLFYPPEGNSYYQITSTNYGKLCILENAISYREKDQYVGSGNIFQSQEIAEEYAHAFNTFLLLRHQPGTVPADANEQWLIKLDLNTLKIRTVLTRALAWKLGRLTPCFSSQQAALDAVETVGVSAIVHMFNTFQHCKPFMQKESESC